jgi:uncharacterized protein (DUF1810 family)
MDDPYNLQRFVDAQNPVFAQVCSELRTGQKTSHWMWFVFPQIAGLGSSSLARKYALSSLDEAKAYLNHPVLGSRLRESAQLVLSLEGRTIGEVFGTPDDLKFRSSMTLFARADPAEQLFQNALRKYFGGQEDPLTLARL